MHSGAAIPPRALGTLGSGPTLRCLRHSLQQKSSCCRLMCCSRSPKRPKGGRSGHCGHSCCSSCLRECTRSPRGLRCRGQPAAPKALSHHQPTLGFWDMSWTCRQQGLPHAAVCDPGGALTCTAQTPFHLQSRCHTSSRAAVAGGRWWKRQGASSQRQPGGRSKRSCEQGTWGMWPLRVRTGAWARVLPGNPSQLQEAHGPHPIWLYPPQAAGAEP